MIYRLFSTACLALVLAGCGTVQNGTQGTYLPSPSNGYRGLIGWVVSGSEYVQMAENCAKYGGLKSWDYPRGWERGGGPTIGVMYQNYECHGLIINQSEPTAIKINSSRPQPHGQTSPKMGSEIDARSNIESASKKCIDLGFKKGTELYGGCVLKLSK